MEEGWAEAVGELVTEGGIKERSGVRVATPRPKGVLGAKPFIDPKMDVSRGSLRDLLYCRKCIPMSADLGFDDTSPGE